MLKIDVISGFLGAGKTTFIKRLLDTKLKNEKVVLIENEYGEISVDTDLLKDTNISIKEISQGCICCSLVGDFSKSLNEIIDKYNPDRILIEPSGVGKLSDIIKAIASANLQNNINSLVCMVDAKKAKMYDKNFGEFFTDQIANAHTVVLSRMDIVKEENAQTALEIIRKYNEKCVVITTPISKLSDDDLLNAYEGIDYDLLKDLDDEECECGHHHHHHADEVFNSFGMETVKKYDLEQLKSVLNDMANGKYGQIVRSKGIIAATDDKWYTFNLTPEEFEIVPANPIHMGKIVVIGAHINTDDIKKLF